MWASADFRRYCIPEDVRQCENLKVHLKILFSLENFPVFWTISSGYDDYIGSQNKHAPYFLANTLTYRNNRRLKNYISSGIELNIGKFFFFHSSAGNSE
jgi:hypothetical protein